MLRLLAYLCKDLKPSVRENAGGKKKGQAKKTSWQQQLHFFTHRVTGLSKVIWSLWQFLLALGDFLELLLGIILSYF